MKIPNSNRKKALIIIDVQPAFVNERNEYIVANIVKLIKNTKYDLYVEVVFHAEKGSLWEKQCNWMCPKNGAFHTLSEIKDAMNHLDVVQIEKEKKSVFKGDKDLFKLLRENGIEEIHAVGTETNDCILASAYESFDLGFFTYVIEECCQSASSDELHEKGLEVLRRQHVTNNSCVEKIDFTEI